MFYEEEQSDKSSSLFLPGKHFYSGSNKATGEGFMRLLEWMNFASTSARETGTEVLSFLCKRQKEHNPPCGARKSDQMAEQVTWSTAAGTLSVSSPNPAPSCPTHHPLFHLGEGGSAFPKKSSLASFLLLFLSGLVAFLWWGLARKLVSPPVLHPPRKVQNVQTGVWQSRNRRVAQLKGAVSIHTADSLLLYSRN